MGRNTTTDYIAAIASMLLNAFCLACASLLFDLADDAGFNPFEIMFFRGFVAFIGGIIYDVFDKSIQNNNNNNNNIQPNTSTIASIINNNDTNINLSSDSTSIPVDMSLSSSIQKDETTSLINQTTLDCTSDESNHRQPSIDSQSNSKWNCCNINWSKIDFMYTINLFKNGEYPSTLWLAIRGTVRVATTALFYFSLTWIYLGTCVTLYDTSPIWSLFFDKFMFDKQLTWRHYLVTLLVLIGMILVVQAPFIFSSGNNDSKTDSSILTVLGYVCGICSAIFQSVAFATMQKFTNIEKEKKDKNINISDVSIIFAGMYSVTIQYAIIGIIGSFIVYGEFLYDNLSVVGVDGIFYVISIGLFGLIALITANFSLSKLSVNEVSLLALNEVIWAYIFQIVIFGQTPNWIEIIGILLIIGPMCGLFGYYICREKTRTTDPQQA